MTDDQPGDREADGAEADGAEAAVAEVPVVLPALVRERVLVLAADAVGVMPAGEVPARLRAVARFAPARRAKLGAGPLSTSLDHDPAFLARVAELARVRAPDLAEELEAGRTPAASDPIDVAAVAYVLRAPHWVACVAAAARAVDASAGSARGAEQEVLRLRAQLDALRAQGKAALDEQRRLAAEARAETTGLRRTIADARRDTAAAEARAQAAAVDSAATTAEADRRVAGAESESRRLRDRLAEVEDALEGARRNVRQSRSAEDVRLRLLLDTVVDAAAGLRRELALAPVQAGTRPADAVAEAIADLTGEQGAPSGTRAARARALLPDDPAVLDQLLGLPQVHLVVDGYNVTKTGYGTLPLDAQRARLLTGLAGLAAQTSAEVTCVFDGAALDQPTPAAQPRGVRVVFSPAGTTADSVIRRLVRAEPAGRAVVVVSSDREVADGVAAAGARPVAAAALVRRLDRG